MFPTGVKKPVDISTCWYIKINYRLQYLHVLASNSLKACNEEVHKWEVKNSQVLGSLL